MKLIVFGATGKTGQHVWRGALDLGHEVTAFTRSPDRIDASAGVRVVQGDVADADAVAGAVAGQNGAIVVLGSNGLRDRTTLTSGTSRLVEGMKLHRVERLVVLSAAGVGDSWDQIPLLSRVMFKTLLRNIHADHTAQEAVVRSSGLDWTIVRAAVLSDDPPSGDVVATNTGRVTRIGRADLADFLVREAAEGAYRGQAISVTS
ncbi:MAG: NAD(P)H-binding protein [Dehalococcoidia bacterium]|nr:NAD(P)H-binding protein [Dehalococcoidia bacterium]